jgi:hypothetical protein
MVTRSEALEGAAIRAEANPKTLIWVWPSSAKGKVNWHTTDDYATFKEIKPGTVYFEVFCNHREVSEK